jgi:hypothetical protein
VCLISSPKKTRGPISLPKRFVTLFIPCYVGLITTKLDIGNLVKSTFLATRNKKILGPLWFKTVAVFKFKCYPAWPDEFAKKITQNVAQTF